MLKKKIYLTIKKEKKIITKPQVLNKRSKLFKTIIESIVHKKGEHIISLDFKKIKNSLNDYFIICDASNTIQIKAIAEYVEEKIQIECNEKPFRIDGKDFNNWVILDYIDIVVHIMKHEIRDFYQLEELWSDATYQNHSA